MRVVGGVLRGRPIIAPPGTNTRPTSDRAREALFNILVHGSPTIEGHDFLDLFAGSGAVGIEAASRGARKTVLVERDPSAIQAIQQNIDSLHIGHAVELKRFDATALSHCDRPFDHVFLDPPYSEGLVENCLRRLISGNWVAHGGRIVCETAAGEELQIPEGIVAEVTKRYGAARMHFLRRAV